MPLADLTAKIVFTCLVLVSTALAHAENIKIGIPSLTITMMPVAVAKEQGFFQREGLNVEMVLMPASLNIKVLLSGDIQYATTITAGIVANVRGRQHARRHVFRRPATARSGGTPRN